MMMAFCSAKARRCRSTSRFSVFSIKDPWIRSFGTKQNDDDDDDDLSKSPSSSTRNGGSTSPSLSSLTDPSLRGAGQVLFLNSPLSGAVILGSLAIGDPHVALLATTGTLTSTLTAQSVLTVDGIQDGLLSYNGCLMGCATAVFVAPLEPALSVSALASSLAITVTGAAASTVVTASLGRLFGTMPQWTFAFNFCMLTLLLRSQPLLEGSSAAAAEAAATTVDSVTLATVPFKGLSQIFVVESMASGLGLVAATALYSPQLAGHALLGSALGSLTGYWLLAVPTSDICAGLWGFNSALTSMGVAVFFNNTRSSLALSAGGAVASAFVFGACQNVFAVAHAPCLTLPFCISMTGCYALAEKIPGLTLADPPHSPEWNQGQ